VSTTGEEELISLQETNFENGKCVKSLSTHVGFAVAQEYGLGQV
jgi:hypothetical protein